MGLLIDFYIFSSVPIQMHSRFLTESWKLESIDTNLKASKTVYFDKNWPKAAENRVIQSKLTTKTCKLCNNQLIV